MVTTAQFVRTNATVEKIVDSACTPEWAICSQADQEWPEGSTHRPYGPDRTMKVHECAAPHHKGMKKYADLRRESQNIGIKSPMGNTTCGKVELAFVKSRKLLETPQSRIHHSVASNGKRDGLKNVRIGQSAAKRRRNAAKVQRLAHGVQTGRYSATKTG
jgi:hypothetical protein